LNPRNVAVFKQMMKPAAELDGIESAALRLTALPAMAVPAMTPAFDRAARRDSFSDGEFMEVK
jgi:hypothetical protein